MKKQRNLPKQLSLTLDLRPIGRNNDSSGNTSNARIADFVAHRHEMRVKTFHERTLADLSRFKGVKRSK